ncbi:uncharacterized protein LOC133767515 isoform X2 [Lepus europaeus]|uniref:uncharacterized protein LOC133767515 isoform X2 n=1 Tax=Lepus europaeus TaxID=9983 RepID=UPI002B46183A|nr:uncharacterized protein LOC133767515 isoform X2 [Lepus europaeus]
MEPWMGRPCLGVSFFAGLCPPALLLHTKDSLEGRGRSNTEGIRGARQDLAFHSTGSGRSSGRVQKKPSSLEMTAPCMLLFLKTFQCDKTGRFYKSLYVVQIFILVGVLCYCFQESLGKIAPDYEISGESSQPIGDTLRPVWGVMDKCYPVTTQRPKIKRGKKQASKKNRKIQKEVALYPSEASEVGSNEERTRAKAPSS